MHAFVDHVALITGAASGIGRELGGTFSARKERESPRSTDRPPALPP